MHSELQVAGDAVKQHGDEVRQVSLKRGNLKMFWSIVRELGLVLGGTGILVAALAWLSRSLLKLWLSKDLETHKSKLAAQSAVEFERLRSALEIQVLEHGV